MKQKIRKICFAIPFLRALYCGVAYLKGWIIIGVPVALAIHNYKKKHREGLFLVFTPEHGNLGDHAIALSEEEMLRKLQLSYYEITDEMLKILDTYGFMGLMNGRVILITGGGNLGMLWPMVEKINRHIIQKNPDSHIFILPNSIYYNNDLDGKKDFEESIKIYNQHSKLFLYARERVSYDIMKKVYKNVKLVPDMVLALEKNNGESKRNGCLLCMRKDVEKTLQEEDMTHIMNIAEQIFENRVHQTDTVLPFAVLKTQRRAEVEKKLGEFCSAELVITDRLHGMIFCAITGTKCIVLNSKSPKVKGSYEWLKELSYVKFANSPEDIRKLYYEMESGTYSNQVVLNIFDELERDITEAVHINAK